MASTFKIRTPDNVGREYQMPDEGQLFRDTGGRIGMIKGGQPLFLDPGAYLNSIGKLNVPGTERGLYSNIEGVRAAAGKELGFNFDDPNIQNWNPSDYMAAAGVKEQGVGLSLTPEMLKSAYGSGSLAPTINPATGGERILSAAETPALISGEGGPKDAQGNLITPDKYAQYGINDLKPAPAQTVVNGVVQPTAGQTPTVETSGQQQILNLEAMAKYKPTDYTRLADGSVVLNPGVQPIAGTTKPYGGAVAGATPEVPGTTPTAQYQILDLESMKKYTPDQYERLPDGRVVLKPGVQPIEGTVKQVGNAPGATGMEGQYAPGGQTIGADGTAAGTVDTATGMPSSTADFYTKQTEENQKFYTDMLDKITAQQKEFLDAYTNQPSMVDELKRLREEQGLPQLEKEIALIDRQILDTEGLMDNLEKDISARTAGFPVSESARRRMLALEGKPLSEQMNQLIRGRTRLATGLSAKENVVKQIMDATASEQDKAINAEKMKLGFNQENLDAVSKLFSEGQATKEKVFIDQMNQAAAAIEADNKIAAEDREIYLAVAKEQAMKDAGLGKYSEDSTIPTDIITANGRQLLVNTQTGETIKDLGGAYKASSGGGGGGGGGTGGGTGGTTTTTTEQKPLSFEEWIKPMKDSGTIPQDISDPSIMAQIEPVYQDYVRTFRGKTTTKTTADLKTLQKLLSPTDKQKMISQGLNYNNADDINNFINGKYEEESSSGGGIDSIKSKYGL